MVIYADILLLVNFAVDYFLLRLTAVLLKLNPPLWRTLLATAAAALTSLYIFLPQSPAIIEISLRAVFCLIITFIGFGFKNIRAFIRASALFLLITFGFAGSMAAFWYVFKPSGMAINNSAVYFDISPLALILSSAVFYFAVSIVKYFFGRKNISAKKCEVILYLNENSVALNGIIDTGNSLCDPFSGDAVILCNEKDVNCLFKDLFSERYRAVPCKTVSGSALLEGYRTDRAEIIKDGKKTVIKNAVAAISKTEIAENGAIINPEIFEE